MNFDHSVLTKSCCHDRISAQTPTVSPMQFVRPAWAPTKHTLTRGDVRLVL